MSVTLTRTRVENLLDTLNALICEEGMLTSKQRENMVMTVATLGALDERIRRAAEDKEERKATRTAKKDKKPREPDPVFPRSGAPWTDDDLSLIHSIIDDIPDEEIGNQVLWLSDKQGRTPYAIALKIWSEGRCDEKWTKIFKPAAKEIRAVREKWAENGVQPV
ncbi:hypothetical protein AZH90_004334 [Salmonella enterica subsp. enterica serovar Legon]|nr:hypothetical protein [Salmonella enterica subsp. enterica serovar Derby]EDS6807064.1 hypothetical protein [Salmonella enterica subsp. enterica serovar Legon]EDW9825397.1 hypothetical protein [Salmonella enterica]EDZ3589449.1 hypothetical protein [Salmonella enterica subsp. enterica serovar Wagenia]